MAGSGTDGGDLAALPSLLWPPDRHPESGRGSRLSAETFADLDLAPVVQALSGREQQREAFVTGVLGWLCTDPEVIAYRADVLANLLDAPELRRRLSDLLPNMATLVRERRRPMFGYQWSLTEIVDRLADLELYVDVAVALSEALSTGVHAPALRALQAAVDTLIRSEAFEALQAELPALRDQVNGVQSVTIGINLSRDLQPESATILSIDDQRIEGRGGMLERLLGQESAGRGVTRLRGGPGSSLRAFFPPMGPDGYGRHNPLVDDLRKLLERVMTPVGEAIERYVWVHTRDFAALESELSFLLNAASLVKRLRGAGLPVCRPEIAPVEERFTCLDGSYNISLALRLMQPSAAEARPIVTNPITFDAKRGRVWILTGPNRGGKTTYARSVGLAQLLFQAGLFVPAAAARMGPVDALYTHFPGRETTTPGEGRLDDEAVRLAGIFREATPHSLILLNEVLSGTSTVEALALACDAVRGLRLLGARAIYVTHLHDLARQIDEMNASTAGDGTIGSLVAEVDDHEGNGAEGHRRTFRIRPRQPLGLSYASEIAEQHGISYPQLLRLLQSRGLVPDS